MFTDHGGGPRAPLPGVTPYTALEVGGRDIYIREGCYTCHSPDGPADARRNAALWRVDPRR